MAEISLIDVSKSYGPVRAADRISFDVASGEFVTVLGPSGSGKTTLLTLLAGLAPLSSGAMRIAGRDVTGLPASARKIGLVFQSYALFPHMSVFDNVAFALSVRGTDVAEIARRVDEALGLVRLTGLESRKPSQLSGGQQQRVALARAIVFRPDILLLDEPLSALDRKLRDELQVELRALQRALGITTLLVTHDQEEALSLSDRVVVLDHGRVQQIDPPEAAYRRPANRFVAEFLGTANLFEGELRGDALVADGGYVLQLPRGGARPPGRAIGMVRPENLRIVAAGAPGGLDATLEATVFLGDTARHHLRLDDGQQVIVTSRGGETPNVAGGGRVSIHAKPEDVWLLPQQAA